MCQFKNENFSCYLILQVFSLTDMYKGKKLSVMAILQNQVLQFKALAVCLHHVLLHCLVKAPAILTSTHLMENTDLINTVFQPC